jgi:hypothetical protein
MKKLIPIFMILFFLMSLGFAQDPSMIFYNGGIPDEEPNDMYFWVWGFQQDPASVAGLGYSPGAEGAQWITSAADGWQGLFIGLNSNVGQDMSSIWETDSVYFKMRAPNGVVETDTMWLYIYDSNNGDWEHSVWMEVPGFQDLNDGEWHQFSMPLADFQDFNNPIDRTDITAISFESSSPSSQGNNIGIASELHIDNAWIGSPDVPLTMTFFSGQALGSQVWFEAWGFENNDLTLAEGEGYVEGTPAIVWETSNWDWQGMGFIMNTHDMSYSFTNDTISLKIKAPAGINPIALEWYDEDYYSYFYVSRYVIDNVTWDGEWHEIKVALADFSMDESFDATRVVEFGIVAAGETIPERLLLDDIWLGDPGIVIDIVPPPTPENITADVSNKYYNLISWDNIESESGETYDVYGSREAIDDLESADVFVVAENVPEGEVTAHNIYYPLSEGDVSFHYAVTCTDGAGNPSEGFGTDGPFTNIGKKRPVISFEESFDFAADGDLSEWEHIMPFTVTPNMLTESNWYSGSTETFDDSLDYTAFCYVAMDDTTLYVAFDVIDDVFSWTAENTSSWWNDEGIEFYFGLYEVGAPHPYFLRGEEPDYRLVFRPGQLDYFNGAEDKLYDEGTANYYFQPLGSQDYLIEARIPLSAIRAEEDAVFTPMEGYTIPFEIFAADADVENSDDVARVQFGDNTALNPWGDGPDVWTFAWIGMPIFTAIGDADPVVVNAYKLGNNYPNPFNPTTTIEYSLANAGHVELYIYNALGQRIATLVNEKNSAGHHQVTFDASEFASGVYFYKMVTQDFNQVKKMLLVK